MKYTKTILGMCAGIALLTNSSAYCAVMKGMVWVHGTSFDDKSFSNQSVGIPGASVRALPYQAAGGGFRMVMEKPGKWRGKAEVGSLGAHAGTYPLMTGDVIRVTFSGENAEFLLEYDGGPTVSIGTASAGKAYGTRQQLEFTIPNGANGRHLAALWCEIDNPGPGGAELIVYDFAVYRKSINTRLDADKILSVPPKQKTRVGLHRGAMSIFVDDKPITGLGWDSIIAHRQPDSAVKMMVGDSGFNCARLIFMLGSDSYGLGVYPPTWLGPDHFDWTYLDQQLGRIISANPRTKVILQVDIDGAKWWTMAHPEARGIAWKNGVPDYLSEQWKKDSRGAIRQLIAHIQTSQFASAVIGYEIMNGATLDCNYEVNTSTPTAVKRFRDFLRKRYKTTKSLRIAWKDSKITFATAVPVSMKRTADDPFALLFAPEMNRAEADSRDFTEWTRSQVIIDFCKAVKEATQGYAIAGARSGDMLCGAWDGLTLGGMRMDYLADTTYLDFFEQWEQYPGRGIGFWGSGAPYIPPTGLAAKNKLVVLENDVRTHTGPDMSCGATPDLATTIVLQRRVFANSLVLGMSPFLWQQGYFYDVPELLPEWQKQADIFERSLKTDRSSGAEIAYVMDASMTKWLGCDTSKKEPTRGFALMDYPRFLWAKSGAPYDMIFLDQIEKAGPYKVYVFFLTSSINEQQMKAIHRVVRQKDRVAVFCWADGLVNGNGQIDPLNIRKLTGMEVKTSKISRKWKMNPADWFSDKLGIAPNIPMGTLEIDEPCDSNAKENTYSPSFTVNDSNVRAIAYYEGTKDVGIAVRTAPKYSTIYCGSVNVAPSVIRYAMKLSGAFEYTDTDDICYINRSFVGLHTKRSGTINVSLPIQSALYDVFNDIEYPVSSNHAVKVDQFNTYLLFKGNKAEWDGLK